MATGNIRNIINQSITCVNTASVVEQKMRGYCGLIKESYRIA